MLINAEEKIKNYSFALFSIYKDENNKSFVQDLLTIKKTLSNDSEIVEILSSYNITKKERKKIINSIYKDNINEYLINFLSILIDNNNFEIIFKVIDNFFEIYNNDNNIVNVKIISSCKLQDKQLNDIIEYLKKKFKKTINYKLVVDNTLIGGLKIIYDKNNIIDFSVKGKLDKLRNNIIWDKGE